MIPAVFEYHRPSTLQDAVALLSQLGDGAKVLAGGQSLIPLMKLRLASQRHVVDLNRIAGLGSIAERDGALVPGRAGRLQEFFQERVRPFVHDTARRVTTERPRGAGVTPRPAGRLRSIVV